MLQPLADGLYHSLVLSSAWERRATQVPRMADVEGEPRRLISYDAIEEGA